MWLSGLGLTPSPKDICCGLLWTPGIYICILIPKFMSMLLGVPAHRRQLGNKDVGAFMLPLVTLEGEETLKLGAYCLTLWCPSHLKGSRRKALSNVCCHDVSVAKIQIIFWLSKLSRLVCSVLTLESELSSQRFCLPFFPRSAIKEYN